MQERAALIALLRHGKRPWHQYADVVEERGSALAVLDDESQRDPTQTSLLPPDNADVLREAQQEIEAWEAQGLRLLTVLDDGYPENLRAVHDRPPVIFVAGDLRSSDARALAVVGARKASPAGARTASEIATHLVASGYTVASGLAAGIDTAAHTAALRAGGRTVAVIGTGLSRCYPPENAALQRTIAQRGAVVSQFWPDAPPTRRSFPMRNATMSGLTLGTVVVEASETSGSRMQARLALAHGRPVFLHSHLVKQHDWAREFATRPGTHIVETPAQVTTIIARLTESGALTA
jgi:DNA processing protein